MCLKFNGVVMYLNHKINDTIYYMENMQESVEG